MSHWTVVAGVCLLSAATCLGAAKAEPKRGPLDPRGGDVVLPVGTTQAQIRFHGKAAGGAP